MVVVGVEELAFNGAVVQGDRGVGAMVIKASVEGADVVGD